jgi:uncharacterized protein YmfQ (DUF2313 family)
MTAALLGEAEFRAALQALLPRGAAWPRHEDAVLTRFLGAIAARQAAFHARVGDLSERESYPPLAAEMLEDWERALGLPDPCSAPLTLLEQRRAAVVARLVERLSPTPAAIEAIAAAFGVRTSVVEFRPHDCEMDCEQPITDEAWAHAFQVWGSGRVVTEATCEDHCEQPLRAWSELPYECAVRRLSPAHTVPLFGSFTDEWDFTAGLPPDVTFTRAGSADRRNFRGAIETVGANVPRLNWQAGLTYNETSNPWGDGAIASPITGFTAIGAGSTWTVTKLGAGFLDGVPYVDVEVLGTAAANTNAIYVSTRDAALPIAAAAGDVFSGWAGVALLEASGFTLSAPALRLNEMTGAFTAGAFTTIASLPGLGQMVHGSATRTFTAGGTNNAAILLSVGNGIVGQVPRYVARFLFPVVNRGSAPVTASVPLGTLSARRGGVPQYGLLGLLLEAGEELRLAVPDGTYAATIEAATPAGAVNTYSAGGFFAANGSLLFAWPAAAVGDGAINLRRIVLRKVT